MPRLPAPQNARMDMKVTAPTESFLDSREFARMGRAIEFIDREYQRQPRLSEIARHVGLSDFHFNRLFRRWTGLTPKQYQDFYDDMTGKGYRPTQICAYPWEDEVRYLVVFEKGE